MELRAKSEPKYYSDAENDAHQFSVRSKSIQLSKKEYKDGGMQTSVIDMRSNYQQMDLKLEVAM